ncbi:MAG: polysaccharide biosynthesis protein PslF [Microbacteriaceae bacterium]|nr:polysaccharide biosynthesis protein PslF [Microbacteriaceae bacterium]
MTSYGFLSTYPPTRCGLATFTEALAADLVGPGDEAVIVRVLDVPEPDPAAPLDGRWSFGADLVAGSVPSIERTVQALNGCDVAVVQHEYGIFGGPDGDEVLEVLRRVRIPVIVVLHTVLTAPTPHQREVLTRVCALAETVVVMTRNARDRLAAGYPVDLHAVRVVPHGVVAEAVALPRLPHVRKRILTWGLLSPGKGIEWGIRAVDRLSDIRPTVEYVVAGQTHPKVRARYGEQYREDLQGLVDDLGLGGSVALDGRYLDAAELRALLATADVVLLPYDSRDQVTSGVLAEAVAAGVPVVATRFPHAVELLAHGAGLLAEQGDPESMARALRTVLTAADVAERMHVSALRETADTSWPAVAARYRSMGADLIRARAA